MHGECRKNKNRDTQRGKFHQHTDEVISLSSEGGFDFTYEPPTIAAAQEMELRHPGNRYHSVKTAEDGMCRRYPQINPVNENQVHGFRLFVWRCLLPVGNNRQQSTNTITEPSVRGLLHWFIIKIWPLCICKRQSLFSVRLQNLFMLSSACDLCFDTQSLVRYFVLTVMFFWKPS